MTFSRYAKAWAALVTSLLTAFLQFSALIPPGNAGLVAFGGAILTAVAVALVSNKIDGFNVDAFTADILHRMNDGQGVRNGES